MSSDLENNPNPFADAEAWEVSTSTLLPIGNHVVVIDDVNDVSTKAGDPQAHLVLKNDEGSIQDWVMYRGDFLAKIVAVFDAAGEARPGPGEFDPSTYRLTGACLFRLGHKKVGIVVREEDKYGGNPGEKVRRVQGYVKPEEIVNSPQPSQTTQQPAAASAGGGGFAADDIPF